MAKKKSPKFHNVHIFEIRFKPNARILDYRGSWAERISEHMGFSEWRIVENRFDVFDADGKNRAFVGYRNAGFTCFDSPTANYFPDHTLKFIKYLLDIDEFNAPIHVARIGVRAKFHTQFDGSYEELVQRYSSRYLILTDKAKKIMNANILDISCPIDFADKLENFNTLIGPIKGTQAQQYLDRDDEFPEAGLFFDIDYWRKPNKSLENDKILEIISSFSSEAWRKNEQITNLILGN